MDLLLAANVDVEANCPAADADGRVGRTIRGDTGRFRLRGAGGKAEVVFSVEADTIPCIPFAAHEQTGAEQRTAVAAFRAAGRLEGVLQPTELTFHTPVGGDGASNRSHVPHETRTDTNLRRGVLVI